ncbi:MAG: hypothetical protein U0V74_05720 [Chitinophagales bacterium]
MNKATVLILSVFALGLGACKRCFTCQQHCAYVVAKNNPNLVYKFCANATTSFHSVDSIYLTFPDSLYNKNKLTDDRSVCDTKNSADEAASFYQKQDYFCTDAQ